MFYVAVSPVLLVPKIKYIPLILAMGICPDEPRSYFMQQYRWCMGTISLVLEIDFWKSNISSIHKLAFINGLLYYVGSALVSSGLLCVSSMLKHLGLTNAEARNTAKPPRRD